MRFRGSHLGRTMLRAAIAAMGATGVIGLATLAHAEDRTLSMYMIHTKETINVTYKRDGVWDEEGLEEINHFMRDWRVDESIKMDRELIDLIWTLHTRLGSQEPIHLISAYRSKRTNDRLRRAGGGQARRSQHTLGKAADIHFPDVPVKKLRASALIQEIGGVGYYPRSGIPFVHVDVGNVRTWPRMPRLELAALFPEGKTAYVPSDGRRITKKDYERAEAKGMVDHVLIAQAQGIAPTMVASLTPPPTPNPVRRLHSFQNRPPQCRWSRPPLILSSSQWRSHLPMPKYRSRRSHLTASRSPASGGRSPGPVRRSGRRGLQRQVSLKVRRKSKPSPHPKPRRLLTKKRSQSMRPHSTRSIPTS